MHETTSLPLIFKDSPFPLPPRAVRRLPGLSLLVPFVLGAQPIALRAVVGGRTIDLSAPGIPVRDSPSDARLARSLAWRTIQPGMQSATIDLAAGAFRIPVQAIVVRVAPAQFRFSLARVTDDNGMTGRWTIDSAGANVVLAMNAGQFKETGPWGWLVLQGEERRSPLRAPLAVGIRIDTSGRIRWVPPTHEPSFRDDRTTAFAFQSFPLLLYDHRVPPTLGDRSLMDLAHRDARLIMAESADGALLFVLTRYALSPMVERVPIGLTTPEALVLIAALGARHAVMLDGGISAQLLLRDATGGEARWRGLRKVPLALVAERRPEH